MIKNENLFIPLNILLSYVCKDMSCIKYRHVLSTNALIRSTNCFYRPFPSMMLRASVLAQTKSRSSWQSVSRIVWRSPCQSISPLYMKPILSPISRMEFMSCVLTIVVMLNSLVKSLMRLSEYHFQEEEVLANRHKVFLA